MSQQPKFGRLAEIKGFGDTRVFGDVRKISLIECSDILHVP